MCPSLITDWGAFSKIGFPGMPPSLSTPSGAQEERNTNNPTIIMNFQATIHYLMELRTGSKKWKPIIKTLFNQLVIELKHLSIIQLAWRRQKKLGCWFDLFFCIRTSTIGTGSTRRRIHRILTCLNFHGVTGCN